MAQPDGSEKSQSGKSSAESSESSRKAQSVKTVQKQCSIHYSCYKFKKYIPSTILDQFLNRGIREKKPALEPLLFVVQTKTATRLSYMSVVSKLIQK